MQVLATARVPPGQSVRMQGATAGRVARIGELQVHVRQFESYPSTLLSLEGSNAGESADANDLLRRGSCTLPAALCTSLLNIPTAAIPSDTWVSSQAGVHSTQGLSSRTGSSRSMRLVDVSQPGASMELSLLDEQVRRPPHGSRLLLTASADVHIVWMIVAKSLQAKWYLGSSCQAAFQPHFVCTGGVCGLAERRR